MTQPQSQLRSTPQADAYALAVADVRARMVAYAAQLWSATPDLGQNGSALLVDRIVPAVQAGQQRVANLTALYLAQSTGTDPVPVNASLVTGGRGVPPSAVYARPVIAARTALSRDMTLLDARAAGGRRLESLVTTDLQMAKVRQADQSLAAAGRTYYRRVPKGESTCALCLIASTQRYKVGNLLPLHPGCNCDVEELPSGVDLDDLFDPAKLLAATHAKVKEFTGIADDGGRAPDYRKLLITHHHGELGPVLAWRGQKFTGPSQINIAPPETKADIARRHLPKLQESLTNLRNQGLADNSPQIAYHLKQIAKLTADLAGA